jgi:hypothetical protein
MPATTVTEYLAALPADRREALNEVRRGINRALPPGYKEGIQFGMNFQTAAYDQLVILCKVWTYFSRRAFQSAEDLVRRLRKSDLRSEFRLASGRMPETKNFYVSRPFVYSIENLEWWQRQFANAGQPWMRTAFKRRFPKTQGRIKQISAKRLRCRGITLPLVHP